MPGDRFMLCSDGLVDEVATSDIVSILSTVSDPTEAARRLVSSAKSRAGRDNITVAVFDVGSTQPGQVVVTAPPQKRFLQKRLAIAAAVVAAMVLLAGIALGATSARSGYFVAFSGESADAVLVIKKGSPEGWLWIKPTIADTFTLTRQDLLPALETELDRNPQFDDLVSARRYAESIAEVASE
jgi:hypothetical protein